MEAQLYTLAQQSLSAWGLSGQLELIKHRENAVFKLTATNGHHYALRLHRPGYHSDRALNSELQWMHDLNQAGIHTPAVISTVEGTSFCKQFSRELNQEYQVDILAWQQGQALGAIDSGLGEDSQAVTDSYTQLGQLAAKLHNFSEGYRPAKGFFRHAWDIEGLVGDQPLWGQFWLHPKLSKGQRQLIEQCRATVQQQLQKLSQDCQVYGLIHADLVPENVLMHQGKPLLIDFDDCGYGWYLFELATALYFLQRDKHYHLAKQALSQAYCQHRQLPPAILEQLPLFLAARGFTYLGWLKDRHSPENEALTPMLIELCCYSCENLLKMKYINS